jgi:general stress protein 26
MSVEVPFTHRDLLSRHISSVFTTRLANGQPHSTLVQAEFDGECATFTTTRRIARTLRRDPHVSLLVVDPDDTGRFLHIRGEVELLDDAEHVRIVARAITCDAIHH